MTPKEKAKELYNKFLAHSASGFTEQQEHIHTQHCAFIAVDLLISEAKADYTTIRYKGCRLNDKEYWQSVRHEIEQL